MYSKRRDYTRVASASLVITSKPPAYLSVIAKVKHRESHANVNIYLCHESSLSNNELAITIKRPEVH